MNWRFPLLLAFCLLPSAFCLAASLLGTSFTYQGRLQQSDAPATGSYDFVFRLYDAPASGSQIGSAVLTNAVPVHDGLFVVQLDFGPDTFTGEDRWLQIYVQTNSGARYQMLSPRQPLTPAPWAQFALKSASASSSTFAATAGGIAGSNLTASADGTLTLRAPSLVLESDRFTNTVTGSASHVVGVNSEVNVGAHLSVSAGGNFQHTIGGDVTQTLGKNLITDVGQNHALSVGGNMALSVNNALTATCGKTAAIDVGTDLLLQAGNQVWLKTGNSSMVMKKDGTITIAGKNITIKGSGEIVAKGSAAFRSAATETNETVIGILGESAATNGIGVLGIATTAADEDVHAGVLAVANAGNKRIALLANCVTNDLLPASAIPRPAAIAGYALANQDILQGYGKSHGLKFRVSDGGVVTATAFTGDGAGLTGIGADALADDSVNAAKIVDGSVANADLANNAVTSAKIADGTIAVADLSPALASNTFWRLGGNGSTTPGTHFLGTTDDQALELRVNHTRALRIQPRTGGTPNLAGGHPLNSIAADSTGSAIGGGGNKVSPNSITANTAIIGGGRGNVIEGDDSAILGGAGNVIQTLSSQSVIGGGENNVIEHDSLRATIGGGSQNCIHPFGSDSTIGGGTGHTNFAFNATIGGGTWNRTDVEAQQATIAGGMGNTIGGFGGAIGGGANNAIGDYVRYAAVAGGQSNQCTAAYATIGGGLQNTNRGYASTVVGGFRNLCRSDYAIIGGGLTNSATGSRSTVGGGEGNQSAGLCATVGGGIRNRSVDTSATVAGGTQNTAHGANASVGGGYENWAGGKYSIVGGGNQNTNNGYASVLGGGSLNLVANDYAAVSGGFHNTAEGMFATVAGGDFNHATGEDSTVGGGFGNTASGDQSTVAGGSQCSATAKGSFAAGWRGHATHEGSFVLADRNDNDLYSDSPNQFTGRFTGGVRFWSSLVGGVRLLPGATSWSILCDRNLKENVQPVDGQDVLRRLTALPLHTWNLTTQDPSIRHLGPMAQDFAAAFQLGETNTCINTVDADGVALAAIQGLNEKFEGRSQKAEGMIRRLEERLVQKDAEIAALKQAVAELKQLVQPPARQTE